MSIEKSVKLEIQNIAAGGWLDDYQPGNGTKYQVFFQQLSAQVSKMLNMGGEPGTLVTFLNIHHSPSILIPSYMGYLSLSYFMEKTGIPEGDAVALVPLLARHLGINKGSS